MKYVIVIADGAADFPLDELDGQTPLEAAKTPNLDALAKVGRLATAHTTPPGFGAGSDVCSMSLLGYDPARYHTGRAPLEAAALGLTLTETDWIFRVNLVTVGSSDGPDAGKMLDHSAGAITNAEARELVLGLMAFWRARAPDLTRQMALTPGVSYRNILVDAGAGGTSGRDYNGVLTIPPHEIPGLGWAEYLPGVRKTGDAAADAGATTLRTLIELSSDYLSGHEVNRSRVARGLRPANMAWIWGQGVRPTMPNFAERFGIRGAMITAVDLLAGIAALMGWERLDVPGITSYHDTDYAAQGQATCDALDDFDIICCHVEAPDEASHQGDWKTKVAAIEAIDARVIGPIMRRLEELGDPEKDAAAAGWRMLVLPDHYTLVSTKKHDATPPPVLMAGAWIRSAVPRTRFTEAQATASDLKINPGHDLMEYFLHGGMARTIRRETRTK